MKIIPAIDIKNGECVRLRQGDMDTSTVFNRNPADQARSWEAAGASRIHVVDLDGSIHGRPANLETIKELVAAVGVPVQLGGGIREEASVRLYLDIGVANVILGTIAAKAPDLVKSILERFPGRISIGIDARKGAVAVQGWTEETDRDAVELARLYEPFRPVSFVYTDIDKDGMMSGPNFESTAEFAGSVERPVILSGGVSSMTDVRRALDLEKDGVTGMIIGRALYEGAIDPAEAIRVAER